MKGIKLLLLVAVAFLSTSGTALAQVTADDLIGAGIVSEHAEAIAQIGLGKTNASKTCLSGGEGCTNSQGGFIQLFGATETTNTGDVQITAANVAGGQIGLITGSSGADVKLYPPTGAQINTAGTNANVLLDRDTSINCTKIGSTSWHCVSATES